MPSTPPSRTIANDTAASDAVDPVAGFSVDTLVKADVDRVIENMLEAQAVFRAYLIRDGSMYRAGTACRDHGIDPIHICANMRAPVPLASLPRMPFGVSSDMWSRLSEDAQYLAMVEMTLQRGGFATKLDRPIAAAVARDSILEQEIAYLEGLRRSSLQVPSIEADVGEQIDILHCVRAEARAFACVFAEHTLVQSVSMENQHADPRMLLDTMLAAARPVADVVFPGADNPPTLATMLAIDVELEEHRSRQHGHPAVPAAAKRGSSISATPTGHRTSSERRTVSRL